MPPLARQYDEFTGELQPVYLDDQCELYQRDTTYRRPVAARRSVVYHNYYLVALDPTTREAFFVSGPDIQLSKVLKLYAPGPSSTEELLVPFREWPRAYQYTYILDRLYSYQVGDLGDEQLLEENETEMIFQVEGVIRRYERVLLEVRVPLDNAESIETKVLSYLNFD